MSPKANLSLIIPTYGREDVLLNTVHDLLKQKSEDVELLIIDQSKEHSVRSKQTLDGWHETCQIRWITQSNPSIPEAMNRGVTEAKAHLLLFLDDDIIPGSAIITAHIKAHSEARAELVVGRVLQPWHEDDHRSEPFTKLEGEFKTEFMGGNFSIRRDILIGLGGFDENFQGAAYRFECEFADRLLQSGGKIWYEPAALIRHLHHSSGGTRSKGDHLTSWNPRHPVGAYYYLLVSPKVSWRLFESFKRFFGSVFTNHHLKAPWYIPVTLFSEAAGFFWAIYLRLQGPKLPFLAKVDGKDIR